ncbi:hypothetical protein SCB49_10887 [unidentified eubacterium SCB49]|nr:hypothetical protein SCB49_10887 [unidentified eubacterium SCB49]
MLFNDNPDTLRSGLFTSIERFDFVASLGVLISAFWLASGSGFDISEVGGLVAFFTSEIVSGCSVLFV